MVDKQEMRLQAMQQGREATVVHGYVKPYVDEKMGNLILKLASLYRSRQAEHGDLIGVAAQVTFCLDMLSDLETRARRGEAAAREELDGPRTN